jgi:hypothetical protein
MSGARANRHRGEIEAELGGVRRRLCLTLGALAELETTFGDADLLALAERFETGRISARAAICIIGAGLRGAGEKLSDEDVAALPLDRGAAGLMAVVVDLLQATFAPAGEVGTPAPGKPGAPLTPQAASPGGD